MNPASASTVTDLVNLTPGLAGVDDVVVSAVVATEWSLLTRNLRWPCRGCHRSGVREVTLLCGS